MEDGLNTICMSSNHSVHQDTQCLLLDYIDFETGPSVDYWYRITFSIIWQLLSAQTFGWTVWYGRSVSWWSRLECMMTKELWRMSLELLNVNTNVNSRSYEPWPTCCIITIKKSTGKAYTLASLGQEYVIQVFSLSWSFRIPYLKTTIANLNLTATKGVIDSGLRSCRQYMETIACVSLPCHGLRLSR